MIKRVLLFLIVSMCFTVSGISKGQKSEKIITYKILTEQILNEKRLKEISMGGKTQGTGGPLIPLSDGSFVTRDTIYEAIQPILQSGMSICPVLIKGLKSDKTHIRSASILALHMITKSELPYYPLIEPSAPINIEAYNRWEQFLFEEKGVERSLPTLDQ